MGSASLLKSPGLLCSVCSLSRAGGGLGGGALSHGEELGKGFTCWAVEVEVFVEKA